MPLQSGNSRSVISRNISEMVRAGHPQRQAVAASLSNARRHPRANGGLIPHYDDGGGIGFGAAPAATSDAPGLQPTAANANPNVQNMTMQFSGMPSENLQELVMRLGPSSPLGQLASRVLQQKRMMPTAAQSGTGGGAPGRGPPRAPQPFQTPTIDPTGLGKTLGQDFKDIAGTPKQATEATPDGQGYARGGGFALGGMPMMSMGMADPPWARSNMRSMDAPTSGFIHSSVPGRTDALRATPGAGSFVVPADVLSGIGEGNSLAGANILQHALGTGPHGVPLPRGGGGRGPPRPPAPFHMQSRGGKTPETVPIAIAGGEFVIDADTVKKIGGGDQEKGLQILHHFCLHIRRKTIKDMRKLKAPVKD